MIDLRGKPVADAMEESIRSRVTALQKDGVLPMLLIVRVGERADDLSYEKNATACGERLGLRVRHAVYPADVTEEEFLASFAAASHDPAVHGILLLRPLPKAIDIKKVKAVFPPEKDLDCLLDENLGKIFLGDKTVSPPCTAQAVIEILHYYRIPVTGKHAVVIGRSMVIGKPLSQLLLNENATVTVCHSRSEDLPRITRQADIVVAAVGKPKLFDGSYFTPEQAVIDVGINLDENGALCGDVAADTVNVAALTPVPGGIGTVTTRVLMQNCVAAAERQARL